MPTRLIAHHIHKEQHSDDVRLTLRDSLIPPSQELESLILNLRESITKRNPTAGKFDRPSGAQPPLQQRILRYLRTVDDAAFVALSRDAVSSLADHMKGEPLATGAYVVFGEHQHGGESYLLVVLLSSRAQPSFDADLNLVSATTLDLEHLRHGARVCLGWVRENRDSVIHSVSKRAQGPSDYFNDFLGFDPVTDPATQGRRLHSALNQWAHQQGLNSDQREDILQKTYTFWHTCRQEKKPITLTALAHVLAPDGPEAILAHLGDEARGLAGEFPPPPQSVMKQYVKFTFSEPGLKIEFDRNTWLNNVGVNGKTVTIRHAPQPLIDMIQSEKHGS